MINPMTLPVLDFRPGAAGPHAGPDGRGIASAGPGRSRLSGIALPVLTAAALAFCVGCSRDDETAPSFKGDFCELVPRQEKFETGEETLVDALKPADVLVAVNGYPLSKKVFDELMVLKAKQISGRKDSNAAFLNNQLADFKKNYIPLFVNQRLLLDKARELKIMSQEEIEKIVNATVRKQAKARKVSVKKFMQSFPGDFKYYLYEMEAKLLLGKLVKQHIPPVGQVTDALVEAFQKAIDEDNAGSARTNEMKRVQMLAWKKDIQEKKTTFEALAKEHNDDDDADEENPGYWGEFERGQIEDKRVQSAVFNLKVGEISDPVEDDDGYHLLKVLSVKAPERNDKGRIIQDEIRTVMHIYVKKLPLLIRDANDILKADLKRQMQIQAINRYLDDLKTNGVTRIEFPHGKKLFE